ncbi:MAG: hypothetical protein AABX66_01410 [Nanoarchaeota archaeon]
MKRCPYFVSAFKLKVFAEKVIQKSINGEGANSVCCQDTNDVSCGSGRITYTITLKLKGVNVIRSYWAEEYKPGIGKTPECFKREREVVLLKSNELSNKIFEEIEALFH